MLFKNKAEFRNLAVLILLACSVARAQEPLQLAGLAVHTDTARDIYVAGLQTPGGQLPGEIASAAGPMTMEYRVATRRISSRGFSGTLLLQAELGSSSRAPEIVIDALGDLKAQLQGSLVSGDQFEIALSPGGDTRFVLNGVTLLELPGAEIFSYLLQGWVGSSASALMRDSLLSGKLDKSLMLRFESLMPLNERVEQVASWVEEEETAAEEEQLAIAAEPEPEPVPAPEVQQEAVTEAAPAAVAVAAAAGSAAPVPLQELPEAPAVEEKIPEPEAVVPAPAETQVAAEIPEEEQSPLQQLDDREYQLQLSEYVRAVMTQVFKNVRYPRRAVKRELQGQVELLAELDQSGELLGIVLEASSGYDILDDAAIRAVEKATPFPELSFVAKEEFADDSGDSYVMLIPVKFMIN
jgi:periplasmic protein TonB